MTKKNGSRSIEEFSPSENARLNLEMLYAECRQWLRDLAKSDNAPLGELLSPVFGSGNLESGIMLVGEAPGKTETEMNMPFVGKAGQTLSAFLESAGFSREAMFITNAVKYRPYRLNAKGGKANRTPIRAEIASQRGLLMAEIALVSPKIVVSLGNSPLYSLTGRADIGACHGMPENLPSGAVLFPLYHPASVIYNSALAVAIQEDMRALRDCANEGF